MADLRSASPLADNYEQVPGNVNGFSGRTIIVSIADSGDAITNDDFVSIIKNLEQAGGDAGALGAGDSDAFTVVAVDGTPGTDQTIVVALQGTGTLDATDAANGVANTSATVVATFDQE